MMARARALSTSLLFVLVASSLAMLAPSPAYAQATAPRASAERANAFDRGDVPGRWRYGIAARALGVMNAADDVTGVPAGGTVATTQAATLGVGDMQLENLSTRHRDFLALGVSTEGLAGALELDTAFGYRPYGALAPVARLGFRVQLLGDGAFYSSLVDLPQAQLGLHAVSGPLAFELSARGGYALVSRLSVPGSAADADGNLDLGLWLDARYALARATLAYSQTVGSDAELPRFAQGELCIDASVGACIRVRTSWFDSRDPGPRTPLALQLGVILAWMDVERR